jgi:hypothetical protein
MKHRSSARPRRRFHRPVPQQPTRAQMRQRVSRLLAVCRIEAAREVRLAEPDLQHLENLHDHIRFFREALEYLEQEP